jgi:PLD-like domain
LGKGLNFAWAAEGADKHNRLHLFPAAYHIKVAVADGTAFFLSSGNFNSTNQPDLDPFGPMTTTQETDLRRSDRDWHVIVEHAGLAKVFEDLILRDLQQATPGQQPAPPPVLKGTGNTLGNAPAKFFKAQTFEGQMTVQPALTPDNYVDVILPLIQGAQKTFRMQTQYIKPSSKFPDDVKLPLAQRSILERLIDAVAVLIKNKVDVRIIVDARVTATMLEQLQTFGGIDGANIRRQHGVHNKGMIFDGKTVVIGSQNWSTEGVDSNRDASVAIQNPQMAAYWGEIFDNDWQTMSLLHEDPVP